MILMVKLSTFVVQLFKLVVSVVALPSLVMIQQNTPPNLLISVIQEKSHKFTVGFPFNTRVKTLNH